MLELAILGLLKERPMHGYDIRKALRDDLGLLSNLSFGSLYPALARLERNGAVRAESGSPSLRRPRTASVPLTGSLGGERAAVARRALSEAAAALGGRGTRSRKVYELTPAGEALFSQLLGETGAADDPKDFSLRLAFARHLAPPGRMRLFERRRNELADRLSAAERSLAIHAPLLDDYGRLLAEHTKDSVAADLGFVEALLERERALAGGSPAADEHGRSRRRRQGADGRDLDHRRSPLPTGSGGAPSKGAGQ